MTYLPRKALQVGLTDVYTSGTTDKFHAVRRWRHRHIRKDIHLELLARLLKCVSYHQKSLRLCYNR